MSAFASCPALLRWAARRRCILRLRECWLSPLKPRPESQVRGICSLAALQIDQFNGAETGHAFKRIQPMSERPWTGCDARQRAGFRFVIQLRQFPFKRFLPLRHARRLARCAISRRARQCEPRRSGADEFAAVTSFAEARPPSTVRQKIKASAQKMLLLHAKTPRNANPNATANAASSLAVCG